MGSNQMTMLAEIREYFRAMGAVKFGGPFKLASGGESDFYVNAKTVLTNSRGLYLASKLAWLIVENQIDLAGEGWPGVAGKAEGTNTLVGGMLYEAASFGASVPGAILRPTAKGHGLGGNWVSGIDMTQKREKWVVVEDVSTTGNSAAEVVQALMEAGQDIALVLTLVDREEGAAARFDEAGVPFRSILKRGDLVTRQV